MQVESYNTERALRKIKRHRPAIAAVNVSDHGHGEINDLTKQNTKERAKSEECTVSQSNDMDVEPQSSESDRSSRGVGEDQQDMQADPPEKLHETESGQPHAYINSTASLMVAHGNETPTERDSTSMDAIRPKRKRKNSKKKKASNADAV